MNRLTNKGISHLLVCNKEYANAMYNKLCQYEDIEEKLGINLVTLFKALENGCYYKDKYGSIIFCEKPRLVPSISYACFHNNCVNSMVGCELVVSKKSYKVFSGHYGKTWALTKEELE